MNESFQQQLRWRSISPTTLCFLTALLILPGLVVFRLSTACDLRFMLGYAVLISLATLALYRHDKRQAIVQGWRTPESTLHLIELLGGWPGAFLAQRALRHKSSKTSYQVVFWVIIVGHQMAAFDFLQDWHYSKRILQSLGL